MSIKLLRIIVLAILLPVVAGCFKQMDPFTGSDGVRVNINSSKCVMQSISGINHASYTNDGTNYVFTASYLSMVRTLDNAGFSISFTVKDSSPLVTGKRYNTNGSTIVTLVNYPDCPGMDVSMSGWIQFNRIEEESSIVEATFELDAQPAGGKKITAKHGFLRLLKQKGNN